MKKILLTICALLLLAGCENTLTPDVKDNVEKAIEIIAGINMPAVETNNAVKDYYTYYLPKGVGREERDRTSNLFTIYDNRAILNLDVAGIIEENFYSAARANTYDGFRDVVTFKDTVVEKKGTFLNSSNELRQYRVIVSAIADNRCYVLVQTNEFIFVSTCAPLECDEMVYEMMKIIRSCHCDISKVIADYSNINTENYATRTISLFKEVLPESGYIADYIEDWKKDPGFVIIDNSDKQQDDPGIDD
ncbi:MAG: hypothetical protein IJM79_08245, partial [Erysipelotrichaceae bacterium]|nr:hypothetical protein [Erysipelotrichaceae bacterium]